MASGLRLPEPPYRKFDIVGLKLSPALDVGLISVLRVFLEILTGELPRERMRSGELLSDERGSFMFRACPKVPAGTNWRARNQLVLPVSTPGRKRHIRRPQQSARWGRFAEGIRP